MNNYQHYYLSSQIFTGAVTTNDKHIIIATPPIVNKFKDQPLNNLIDWIKGKDPQLKFQRMYHD